MTYGIPRLLEVNRAEEVFIKELGYIQYSEFCDKTRKRMVTVEDDLCHMALGIAGEAGELVDAIKKKWAYGKPLDTMNVIEELGDLEWYMEGLRQILGLDRKSILQHNATKLSARYPRGIYTDQDAVERKDKV